MARLLLDPKQRADVGGVAQLASSWVPQAQETQDRAGSGNGRVLSINVGERFLVLTHPA